MLSDIPSSFSAFHPSLSIHGSISVPWEWIEDVVGSLGRAAIIRLEREGHCRARNPLTGCPLGTSIVGIGAW